MTSKTCLLTYFKVSECMRAVRNPGKVNNEPTKPHKTAKENLTIILDAGPL